MEISKKDLLKETGISYGQLYQMCIRDSDIFVESWAYQRQNISRIF